MGTGEREWQHGADLGRCLVAGLLACLWFLTTLFMAPELQAAGTNYTITASAGSGGSISPTGAVTVKSGASQTFTMTPVAGYHIANVIVDSISQGAPFSYSFTNVRANHTISATFAINTYTVTPSAGTGGSISPASLVTLNYGGSQTFTFSAATGYHIANVTVDGSSLGAISTYTFNNVAANHIISATFAVDTYTITPSAGTGGSISPASVVTLNYGGSQTFTFSPTAGYHIANVTADGASLGAISTYTFNNVAANHTISATFTVDTYTITPSAGAGGSISPASLVTLNYGGSQTFTFSPASGYHIANVSVDGTSQGAISTYTFNNVTGNHTITANYAATTPPVSYAYDDVGRLTKVISGSEAVIYSYDEVGNLTSTTRSAVTAGPPVLSSITPAVLFVGSKSLVVITGVGLLSTQSVTSANGLVAVSKVSSTDTKLIAEMTALSAGTDTITVTNNTGDSAPIAINLSAARLSLYPSQMVLAPGANGTITATITPPLSDPVTLNLNNSASTIAASPQSIIIPPSGSATFTVNALQAGISTIDAGEPRSVVMVTPPFSGVVNGLSSANVSVMIDSPNGSYPAISHPVGVLIDAPLGTTTNTSPPVSVIISAPAGEAAVVSGGVSVKIQ